MSAAEDKCENENRMSFISKDSRQKVKLQILNNSSRSVNVNWISYQGIEVFYLTLEPKQTFVIDSFVTHPWIFRDLERQNLVPVCFFVTDKRNIVKVLKHNNFMEGRLSKQEYVFFPVPHSSEEFIHVRVTNGVYPLKQICFNHFIDQDIKLSSDLVPNVIALEFEQYEKGQKLKDIYGDYFVRCD